MKNKTYITKFLEDKGIFENNIECLEEQGHFNLTWADLANFINQMPANIQKTIENTMTMIDFKNGDYMHYLNFLANGMIQSIY